MSLLHLLKWGLFFLIFIGSYFYNPLFAQVSEIDKILEAYSQGVLTPEEAILQQLELAYSIRDVGPENSFIKCLTPAYVLLDEYKNELSPSFLNQIESYSPKSDRDFHRTYISSKKKFSISYDTTGNNAVPKVDINLNGVPDYVEWVAEAADSSYNYQVLKIGFPDPIPAETQYNIFIADIGAGTYGYATPISSSGAKSEIFIHNNFSGFPENSDLEGNQKGAIKVTVAHEFKHAIQFDNNWSGPSSLAWTEMDATLMEEVVYDEVNDYYNYIKKSFSSNLPSQSSIFGNPSNSIPNNSGRYANMTWLLHYAENYGIEIIKNTWERLALNQNQNFEIALIEALHEKDRLFETTFVQNHLWHFASGSRSGNSAYGFKEKLFYPNSTLLQQFHSVPTNAVSFNSIETYAAQYFEIVPTLEDRGIIDLAINFDSTKVGLGVLVYDRNGKTYEYVKTGSDKPQIYLPLKDHLWEDIKGLGVIVTNYSDTKTTGSLKLLVGKQGNRFTIKDPDIYKPDQFVLKQNYPNPFNTSTNIEFTLNIPGKVKLEVYDVIGRKIQTIIDENLFFGEYSKTFNTNNLSSGLYIYRLNFEGNIKTKKMIHIK